MTPEDPTESEGPQAGDNPRSAAGSRGRSFLGRWGVVIAAATILVLGLIVSAMNVQAANQEKDEAVLAAQESAKEAIEEAESEAAKASGRLSISEESNNNLEDRLGDSVAEIARLKKQVKSLTTQLKKAKQSAAAPSPTPNPPAAGNRCPNGHICYTITSTGSSSVDVTYTNKSGGTSQAIGAALPWFLDLGAAGYNIDFLYVSGQQSGSGTVTCTIWDGNTVYTKGTSSGQYSICTASD